MLLKVFVDSDVAISSLISQTGAAHLLLNSKYLQCFVSNLSIKEQEIVIDRLNIDRVSFKKLIKKRFTQIHLKETTEKLKDQFKDYVVDASDAHIVAGAKAATVQFLVSYNIKDFRVDAIKQDFGILVLTPANLVQYLRSLES